MKYFIIKIVKSNLILKILLQFIYLNSFPRLNLGYSMLFPCF